jgi:phosphatidylglycerophosphate synthase
MLSHQLNLAAELSGEAGDPVIVYGRAEELRELRALVRDRTVAGVVFEPGPPPADAAVLRTDRFYDAAGLARSVRRGRTPELAVLWKLDQPVSLLAADEELSRRLTYQPLGKFWAFPLAWRLAESLRSTPVRPNAVTMIAAALMLAAAGGIAFGPGGWLAQLAVATALALALVLDTADGRLARLQGTSSALGRWLDHVLDELADIALHAAIAWSAFIRDSQPLWLLVGIVYASGKYLFLVQSIAGEELEGRRRGRPHRAPLVEPRQRRRPRGIATLAEAMRLIGHADIRWHLWIAFAAIGRLDLALAAYAGYFPLRAFAGAVRKGVRHA